MSIGDNVKIGDVVKIKTINDSEGFFIGKVLQDNTIEILRSINSIYYNNSIINFFRPDIKKIYSKEEYPEYYI